MKANVFRIQTIALALGLLCMSALQPVYASDEAPGSAAKASPARAGATGEARGSAKSAPPAPAAIASKHTAPEPHAPVASQINVPSGATSGSGLTGSELTGSELTGSELTGSELTGSELTGSQLTGFGIGFERPSFSRPPFPEPILDLSQTERAHRRSRFPDEGQTPDPQPDDIAPVAHTAPASPTYSDAELQLQSAKSNYEAALARIRARLNENATYRQARAGQTATSSPGDTKDIDTALTVTEMETRAVAADPDANAARQQLDDAVLAHATAERAQAAPRATANGR